MLATLQDVAESNAHMQLIMQNSAPQHRKHQLIQQVIFQLLTPQG